MERRLIHDAKRDVALEVIVVGATPSVVLLPAATRGGGDFAALQGALAGVGIGSVAVNPRGAGATRGPLDDLTLQDLVDDVTLVIDGTCDGRAHLVGHALGNVVVRATAHYRPDAVATVTVMPCGGGPSSVATEIDQAVIEALGKCGDRELPEYERLDAIRLAFFAPGNDPSVWRDGWWPATARLATAIGRSDRDDWWRAGSCPVLIIQGLQDAMVAAEVGRSAATALGDRATYHELDRCGHAMLPEQPDAIAQRLIDFLSARST